MPGKINVGNISIVLHKPRHPENIGAAARCMCNMGLSQLVVVNPKNYILEKVLKLATHVAADIVKHIKFYEDLKEALSGYNYVIGTTARLGGERQVVSSPSELAAKLISISEKKPDCHCFWT